MLCPCAPQGVGVRADAILPPEKKASEASRYALPRIAGENLPICGILNKGVILKIPDF
jgi:hypothetical protein